MELSPYKSDPRGYSPEQDIAAEKHRPIGICVLVSDRYHPVESVWSGIIIISYDRLKFGVCYLIGASQCLLRPRLTLTKYITTKIFYSIREVSDSVRVTRLTL
jgi:hypothetical protein